MLAWTCYIWDVRWFLHMRRHLFGEAPDVQLQLFVKAGVAREGGDERTSHFPCSKKQCATSRYNCQIFVVYSAVRYVLTVRHLGRIFPAVCYIQQCI